MATTLRQLIDERHAAIRARVVRMGNLASDMARLAVDAAVQEQLDLADRVIAMDDEIDREEHALTQELIRAMALEAPVAKDLQFLLSTLGILGELERAADHAVKLARRIKKLRGSFPGELKLPLHQMSEESRRLLAASVKLYVEYDPVLAAEIRNADEQIDEQYAHTRRLVIQKIEENPAETRQLMRSLAAFSALEHLADQAVEIARRLSLHFEDVAA